MCLHVNTLHTVRHCQDAHAHTNSSTESILKYSTNTKRIKHKHLQYVQLWQQVKLTNPNMRSESALTSTKFRSNVCIMENPFRLQSGPSVDITERELILRQPTGQASHSTLNNNTAAWLAACQESSQSASCFQRGERGSQRSTNCK